MTAQGPMEFRPLVEADLTMLADWLARPHVVQWWGGDDAALDVQGVRRKYLPRMAMDSPAQSHIALLDHQPIGFIQSYVVMGSGEGWWESETDPGARGIDQFLAHEHQLGQGLGTRMIRAFVAQLFSDSAVSKVQTDPHPSNTRAIACYRKCGFRTIGQIVTPDGPALLMVQDRGR
jgi:RimJ/RimL family protein N-acetyltransferase